MLRYLTRVLPAPTVLLVGAMPDASAVDPLSGGKSARNGKVLRKLASADGPSNGLAADGLLRRLYAVIGGNSEPTRTGRLTADEQY